MANLFDSTNYPTKEPAVIVAGDRVAWKHAGLSNYPVAEYTLKYSAQLEAESVEATEIKVTALASINEHIIELSSQTTSDFKAGVYHWQAHIVRISDGERITINSGTWEVKPNKNVAGIDPRSHIKKVLDAIEATIEGRASKDQETYSIQGRSLSRTPIPDLIMLRDRYKSDYVREKRKERIEKGLGHRGTIKARL